MRPNWWFAATLKVNNALVDNNATAEPTISDNMYNDK